MYPLRYVDVPRVLEQISADQSRSMYGTYFTENTGAYFEPFSALSDPMRFEASDLIAIEALSVQLHPHGAIQLLLDKAFADECSALLRQIPVGIPLAEVDASVVADGSPADQLWKALRTVHGMGHGRTVISKLMAAKRPLLLPIWDTMVATVIAEPDGGFWSPTHRLVSDPASRRSIEEATKSAPDHVGLLRRIDVALWRFAKTLPANQSPAGSPALAPELPHRS